MASIQKLYSKLIKLNIKIAIAQCNETADITDSKIISSFNTAMKVINDIEKTSNTEDENDVDYTSLIANIPRPKIQ